LGNGELVVQADHVGLEGGRLGVDPDEAIVKAPLSHLPGYRNRAWLGPIEDYDS